MFEKTFSKPVLECFIFLLFFLNPSSSSFLDWLGFQKNLQVPVSRLPLIKIPFEELDPEEKFLLEANKITGLKLDDLDVCQQKLVMKLKTSCGQLSDEELSKLSVGLLNCQSEVEGRKIFPCTTEMTLKECTREMDPDVWNSYHVVSNRARAVCYAVRQEHFRALSEMTINKLMEISHEHINKMANVEDKQKKLGESTEAILNQLIISQSNVLASYNNLKKLESSLISSIAFGVNKMEYQKQMITDFQQIITSMMSKFQSELSASGDLLAEQMTWNREQHKSLRTSLNQLHKITVEIVQKLNESNTALREREKEILAQTDAALQRLNSINVSVTNMATWAESLEKASLPKFQWIKTIIGDKGEKLDMLMVLTTHVAALLAAMLLCSFLAVPFTSRWLLFTASSVNIYLATSSYYQEYSSELYQFYIGFLVIVFGDYCSRYLYRLFNTFDKPIRSKNNTGTSNTANNFAVRGTLNNNDTYADYKVKSWLSGKYSTGQRNGHLPDTTFTPVKRVDEDVEDDNSEYNLSQKIAAVVTPTSVAGSSSTRSRCSAICKSGTPCRNQAYGGTSRCRIHGRGSSENR